MRLAIRIRGVAVVLMSIAVLLMIGHFLLAGREWDGFRLFNLGAEGSFGTSFASILGVVAGLLALGAAMSARKEGRPFLAVAVLGIGMILYAIDEVAMVHEGLGSTAAEAADFENDGMVGTVMIGLAIAPVFVAVIWALLRSVPRRAGLLMASGLTLFWLAAFGVEQFEHMNHIGTLPMTSGMSREEGDLLLMGIQEGLEMIAIIIVLLGILGLLAAYRTVLSLEVESAQPHASGQRTQ